MGSPRIKAVSFDLWETLLLERDRADRLRSAARCQALSEALAALGVDLSLEEVTRAHDALASWLTQFWVKNEDVTHLDHLCFILREASGGSLTLKPEWIGPLTEAYISPLFKVPPWLDPEAAPTLAALRERGKRLCLISNVGRTPSLALRRFLAQAGLLDLFDALLFSDEARVRKPSVRIFHLAAERLGLAPAEIVHVGDQLAADIHGAKAAGMRAVLLSSQVGHDREAEADPSSLISISVRLADQTTAKVDPDATIHSLSELVQTIDRLDGA